MFVAKILKFGEYTEKFRSTVVFGFVCLLFKSKNSYRAAIAQSKVNATSSAPQSPPFPIVLLCLLNVFLNGSSRYLSLSPIHLTNVVPGTVLDARCTKQTNGEERSANNGNSS